MRTVFRWSDGGRRLAHWVPTSGAVAAAVISLGLGLRTVVGVRDSDAAFPWRGALAPLASLPAHTGDRIVLVPPANVSSSERLFWIYEARWRRPDLLWCFLEEWPGKEPPALGVLVRAGQVPSGYEAAWRAGDLTLVTMRAKAPEP